MKNEPVEKLAARLPQLRKELAKARRAHSTTPSLQAYMGVANALMALGKELSAISASAALEIMDLDKQLRADIKQDIAALQDKVALPVMPATQTETIQ